MVVVTAEYDLSQPISAILRKATFDARSAGQYNAGLGWLTRGELEKDEYVRFLMMLWHIYEYVSIHLIHYKLEFSKACV
jgi:heme oxygenase